MNRAKREWQRLLTDALSQATGCDRATSAIHAGVVLEHLSREFGGQRVYVPVNSQPLPTAKILELIESGLSATEVARRFGVSSHTIRNHARLGQKQEDSRHG
jgi:DNA-binding NarL/FixJ family response regulator